jgi:ABC-type nitrate/sulfonate/bicarbonate transport system substrate-binding protein
LRKWDFCRFILLVAAGLLIGGIAPLRAQPSSDLDDITFAYPGFALSLADIFIADDLGLWTKHGLRTKEVQIAGVGSINAVISGSVDFGEASALSTTRAAARGQKLLIVASLHTRPMVQVSLRKSVADAAGVTATTPFEKRGVALKGRTIIVDTINSVVHAYVRLIAVRAGIDPETVRVAPMQPLDMLAAYDKNQADGMAQTLPWPMKPVEDGSAIMLGDGPKGEPADMNPSVNTVVIARAETCEKRPALCQKVGQTFAEVVDIIKNRPADALAIFQKRFSTLDPKLIAAAFDEVRTATADPPVTSAEALRHAELFNVEAGLLKRDEMLSSYDGLFTDKYVKR